MQVYRSSIGHLGAIKLCKKLLFGKTYGSVVLVVQEMVSDAVLITATRICGAVAACYVAWQVRAIIELQAIGRTVRRSKLPHAVGTSRMLTRNTHKISVLGGGGHCKVVISVIKAALGSHAIDAVYDDDLEKAGGSIMGVPILKMDKLHANGCAVIAIGNNSVRKRFEERFPDVTWVTLVHPCATVDPTAEIGPGTVIMAGAVVQAEVRIGRHAILNTRSSVDHECALADFATVGPGATICGGVQIGEGGYICAGSTVRESTTVADWCTLGMGAALTRSMPMQGETWVGVPARARSALPG